jgi:hypothetical protein
MAQSGTFGIEKRGISHLLLDSNLAVPLYQRSYAWESRNVTDFLDDIERALKKDAPEYFLGSIVLAQSQTLRGRPEVVDGQQRLATTTILIAQVRDYFKSINDQRHQDIDGQFLMNRDLRSQEDVQKLQLNERDNDFFLKSILRPNGEVVPQRDSHRAIAQAKDLCSRRVQELVKSSKTPEILIDLVMYLKEQAQVIVLSVPSDENAFVLFETLNDRGLDLALSDLLKNYLFRVAGNRLPEVQASWVSMYSLFEASNSEAEVVGFIRQAYSASHGLTRVKEVLTEIKKTVTGKQNAIEFAEELRQSAALFQALLNPAHPFWRNFNGSAARHVATLNDLGLTRIRPLLLAILERFEREEARKSLKRAVNWAVRLTVAGNLGSGTVEDAFCQRAKEIKDGVIKDADALSSTIEPVVPNDAAFEESFRNFSVTKNKLARYLLQALERQEGGEEEPELIVNSDPSEVNLEHVLPQNPGANWPGVSPELAAVFAYRLGNMVLLRKSENESLGNGDFLSKKPVLSASSLQLTKSVGAAGGWGPEEIRQRQSKLAKLAIQVWALR